MACTVDEFVEKCVVIILDILKILFVWYTDSIIYRDVKSRFGAKVIRGASW